MAFAVQDIAQQVVANLGLEGGYELASLWISQRYQELCARAKFRHLRQLGQIYVPAPINTGTATVTLDSATVQLDSAALAACQQNQFFDWPDGFTGMFFRPQIAVTWYRIASADPNTGILTLETPFSQDNGFLVPTGSTVATSVTFYIVPRYIQLNPAARQLGVFVFDFMYRPLECISEDRLNMIAPNRFQVWAYPEYVAELNSNRFMTGMPKQVEVYPYPTQSLTMHYTYWENPPVLALADQVPPTIDPDILRSGAMCDAANNRMGRAIRGGNLEEAAMWRNIANQYSTEFNSKVNRAIRNDRGADDLSFKLQRLGWKPPLDWDPVKDAWSNFLARGF